MRAVHGDMRMDLQKATTTCAHLDECKQSLEVKVSQLDELCAGLQHGVLRSFVRVVSSAGTLRAISRACAAQADMH